VLIDALVLAGGRSSRLGAVPKAGLVYEGETLLARTLGAAGIARQVVAVGPIDAEALPPQALVAREDPPFSGPAAGIAAGLAALAATGTAPSDVTLVLACDMPHADVVVRTLVDALTDAAAADEIDGVIGVDENGRRQPLAAAYRTSRLAAAVRAHRDELAGLPVSRLIADLTLLPVATPPGATDDVDTWSDAQRLGVAPRPGVELPDTV